MLIQFCVFQRRHHDVGWKESREIQGSLLCVFQFDPVKVVTSPSYMLPHYICLCPCRSVAHSEFVLLHIADSDMFWQRTHKYVEEELRVELESRKQEVNLFH